jgi:hypothetical protein
MDSPYSNPQYYPQEESNTLLYVGIGFFIFLVIGLIIYLVSRSSNTTPAAPKKSPTDPTFNVPPVPNPPPISNSPSNPQTPKNVSISSKNTGFNELGTGNIIFLDRHNVDCGSAGINQFKLNRDSGFGGNIRYDYKCISGGNTNSTLSKNTDFNDVGWSNNVVYLDRHNVNCEDNPISQFKLNRNSSGDKIRYDYKCMYSNKPVSCRNVTTTKNDVGNGNLVYLDRHDVKCNDDELISSFKLTRPDSSTISYDYKCCKY